MKGFLNLNLNLNLLNIKGENEQNRLTPPPRPPSEILLKWWPSAISRSLIVTRTAIAVERKSRRGLTARRLARVCARRLGVALFDAAPMRGCDWPYA